MSNGKSSWILETINLEFCRITITGTSLRRGAKPTSIRSNLVIKIVGLDKKSEKSTNPSFHNSSEPILLSLPLLSEFEMYILKSFLILVLCRVEIPK